ncbi:MAG: hypothetical protein AAGI30_05295 [Planctomycetota bacterium]
MPDARRPLFGFDPGWLWLISGLVLLVAAAVTPAADDVRHAELARDRALAAETREADRLNRYSRYADALASPTDDLVISLAQSHLGLAPASRHVVVSGPAIGDRWAGLPDHLEPAAIAPIDRPPPDSLLHRITSTDRSRLLLSAFALLCVMYGLLPSTRPSPGRDQDDEPIDLAPVPS